jgi:hypothetical protein
MEELIQHLKEEKFAELKAKLRACQSVAEQSTIFDGIESKRLNEFLAWLQADSATISALYMTITGLLLRRERGSCVSARAGFSSEKGRPPISSTVKAISGRAAKRPSRATPRTVLFKTFTPGNRRIKDPRRARVVAALMAGICLCTLTVHPQSATWQVPARLFGLCLPTGIPGLCRSQLRPSRERTRILSTPQVFRSARSTSRPALLPLIYSLTAVFLLSTAPVLSMIRLMRHTNTRE